ncbi:MAG: metal ABC transporter permease [Deltaproteobacteria bacterium]|nr:metal ABC transporter permease [Deltaproteobacteria bacterium]
MEILTFGFMQRALLSGVLIGLACSMLGVFLILRRDAMIGHGLAHVTFGGVAIGLFLGISPLAAALVVAVLSSIFILRIRDRAGVYGDTAIGIVSSVGMGLGIVIVGLSGKFSVELFSYLFGNILAIGVWEVMVSAILAAAVLTAIILNYNELVFSAFDHELARASGLKVDRLDGLLAVLTAVTVVLAMKVVGLLLVAALIVIPAATGLQLASRFRMAIIFSGIAGVVSVLGGLFTAYYLDLPASGAIVLLATLFFLISMAAGRAFRLRG